jgi:hypothetical protein
MESFYYPKKFGTKKRSITIAASFDSKENFHSQDFRSKNELIATILKQNTYKSIHRHRRASPFIKSSMLSPKAIAKSTFSYQMPKSNYSCIATPLNEPNLKVEDCSSVEIDGFLQKCKNLIDKTSAENRKIEKSIHQKRNVLWKQKISGLMRNVYKKSKIQHVFIFGAGMKGRYIKGKYDDVVANCDRIAHADYRLANSYLRLTKSKF